MNKCYQYILGFLLLAIAVWMTITSNMVVQFYLNRVENIAYDMQLHARLFKKTHTEKSPVVIVDIDDKSLHQEGRWPWPREKLAELINDLQELGAVVVALDLTFPEKQSNINKIVETTLIQKDPNSQNLVNALKKYDDFFDEDQSLAKSLHGVDTILGMAFLVKTTITTGKLSPPLMTVSQPDINSLDFLTASGYIANIPELQSASAAQGFMNSFSDIDGVIRREPLLIRYGKNLYPSLALEAVRLYTLTSKINLVTNLYGKNQRLEGIKFGNKVIPTDQQGRVYIPFRGGAGSFPYISAADVLNKKLKPQTLEGALVFVGTSAVGLGDLQTTAIESSFPGVEIHANIAQGIISGNFPHKPPWAAGAQVAELLFFGILSLFIFPHMGPRILAALTVFTPIILIILHNYIWDLTAFILSPLILILFIVALGMMNLSFGYLFESRRREYIKQMFGQYVPIGHIEQMLKGSGDYGFQGEDREMTVLFADIRNFTSLTEFLSASQVKELLNEFFTPMTQVVFNHQGTIDKYVGDMLMAFWGAPLIDKDHARHAIETALDMQMALKTINADFQARKWSSIQIGIGLNTGMMSVGDMGSKFRRNYTVLGDSVNLASRLEGLTKFYGVQIIASQYTHDDQQANFIFRHLDRVRVVGKKSAFDIYEVICRANELTEVISQEISLSEKALNEYFKQNWEEARKLYQELSNNHPSSTLYRLFLNRISTYTQDPPPASWQGVFDHTRK